MSLNDNVIRPLGEIEPGDESIGSRKIFSMDDAMPSRLQQSVKYNTKKNGLFFEIGPDMTRVINARLKEPASVQLFYLFAANHTFQFLEHHQDEFGKDIDADNMAAMLDNITDLRQSVFSCFATLVLGSDGNINNPIYKKRLKELYEEFDTVNPLEVFGFINYCRQWWDATRVIHGFSRSQTRMIYNLRRNHLGLYNPMMTTAEHWWEVVHHQGNLSDHTAHSLAVALVGALNLQAHLDKKSILSGMIFENEETFIDNVANCLIRLVSHYCESQGLLDYAVFDPCKLNDVDAHGLVRFIAFNKTKEITVQLNIGATIVGLKLNRPDMEWFQHNALALKQAKLALA